MPQVMTTNAVVMCPHGGVGTTTPASLKWSVNGGLAVREGDTGTLSCVFVPPCTGYTLRSMGLNSTKIDGVAVILATDFNQSLTGMPLTITETHTTIDDSTPASIPAGDTAPPLAPELIDVTAPVVMPVPPAAAFNSVTMLPATLPIAFTLNHPFPLQWVLTRLSEPTSLNEDLTNGGAGATPVPAGGAWNADGLVVTLTLSAAYMAALGVGLHHFYMTAVSKRGISGYVESILTVS